MAQPFIEFCEKLWRDWLNGKLNLPDTMRRKFAFDLNAAPEPYLSFGAGKVPLIALTTNPGRTMPHQHRAAVKGWASSLKVEKDYGAVARILGAFYEARLTGAARDRIAKLRKLSCLTGCDGVLQVEACPFHSPSLPAKNALLDAVSEDTLLRRYTELLGTFLKPLPVVCPQAVSTGASLEPKIGALSRWLKWMARIAGLDMQKAEFVPLPGNKNSKVTVGAWVSSNNGIPKVLTLRMGAAGLPNDEALGRLAEKLRELRK